VKVGEKNMSIQRGRFNPNPNYKKKYRHFLHSPFSLDHQGVKVEVDGSGKVIITQDQPDGSYDEIITSASLINKVSQMLFTTRKVVYKDEPYKGDETFGDEGETGTE
jgi:hypothetical protein